jgi:hypothetical protein
MPSAILFPDGSEFFDVEGVPVVLLPAKPGAIPSAMAFDPGKPPRPFPVTSVLRNGSPVKEAEFRARAGLPATRQVPRNLKQGPKHPDLEDPAEVKQLVASLRSIGYDDNIPTLLDDDPVDWNTAAAEEAARIAAATMARARR